MTDKRRVIFTTGLSGQSVPYSLRDDFTDTVAAGSVNGTTATPTGQTRTVTDTNTKISVGSGVLSIASLPASDDGVWYPAVTRMTGGLVVSAMINAQGWNECGFDTEQSGAITDAVLLAGTVAKIRSYGLGFFDTVSISLGTKYYTCVVTRAAGALFFIKGGAFTAWTLLATTKGGTDVNRYPAFRFQNNLIGTADFIRVPVTSVSFAPLASDSFNRSDGAIGTADGAGTEETAPTATWTNKQGAATIATNKAVLSTLDGTSGWGIVTLPAGLNILTSVNGTRTGDDFGLVVRYADADNYVKVLHNGTNLQMIKVVAGTPTTLVNAAATYSAGADITCIVDGTSFSAYYNNALIGTTQTVSDAALQTSTSVGLYSTNTANTFDNFRVWDRKSSYSTLDRFIR